MSHNVRVPQRLPKVSILIFSSEEYRLISARSRELNLSFSAGVSHWKEAEGSEEGLQAAPRQSDHGGEERERE